MSVSKIVLHFREQTKEGLDTDVGEERLRLRSTQTLEGTAVQR